MKRFVRIEPLLLTLFVVLLVEGFVTISLEVLSIRQLLPFVGSSVVITSLIIGVFLLFLATGYYLGGQKRADLLGRLQKNFNVSALFAGIGLSFAFCVLFFSFSQRVLKLPLLLSLSLYLILVLAPITALLGQTIPIAASFFKKAQRLSQVSSQTLFLSTVGSFLGAVLTSLVFFNFFGVGATLFFNVALLLSLATLVCWINKKPLKRQVFFVGLCLFALYNLNLKLEHDIFDLTNNYANYKVDEFSQDGKRALIANNIIFSEINEQRKAADYIEYIKSVLFKELKLSKQNILVVGAGGFSLSDENTFKNHFTYLDIDPQLKPLAEKSFLKAKIKGEFISTDVRAYFNQNQKAYDAIVLDTFHRESIPASLTTKEYFLQIRRHLTQGGYAIFNVIAPPFLNNAHAKHLDNTLSSVFKNCIKHPMSYAKITNLIYVCQKNTNESDETFYSDNLNQSSLEQFQFASSLF